MELDTKQVSVDKARTTHIPTMQNKEFFRQGSEKQSMTGTVLHPNVSALAFPQPSHMFLSIWPLKQILSSIFCSW